MWTRACAGLMARIASARRRRRFLWRQCRVSARTTRIERRLVHTVRQLPNIVGAASAGSVCTRAPRRRRCAKCRAASARHHGALAADARAHRVDAQRAAARRGARAQRGARQHACGRRRVQQLTLDRDHPAPAGPQAPGAATGHGGQGRRGGPARRAGRREHAGSVLPAGGPPPRADERPRRGARRLPGARLLCRRFLPFVASGY